MAEASFTPACLPPDFTFEVPELKEGETCHAFISHGSGDIEASYFLLEELESRGFKCFHSQRDFEPGGTINANMAVGMSCSRRVILLISHNFLGSKYFDFEVAQAIQEEIERKCCVKIPFLLDVKPEDVPSSIKQINYIQFDDPEYFKRLVKALINDIPLTAAIPAGNVAHGLVWSYYYGYLQLILPGLRKRAEESEYAKRNVPLLKKFVCILSETSNCPRSMGDENKNIKYIGGITYRLSMAGVVNRDYTTAVHEVKDPDTGKVYLFLGEFCTPLRSMYQMEAGGIAGLSREQRIHQTMLFRDELKEIISNPKAVEGCANAILLLEYRDVETRTGSGVQAKESLSRILVREIRHELDKEEKINDPAIQEEVRKRLKDLHVH